jgi:POT family proton-dependent oligopeptide transporter
MNGSAMGLSQKLREYPTGIPFIIGNEACERFCYYGMRAVLWVHLTRLFVDFKPMAEVASDVRSAVEARATADVHLFFAGVFAFPMLGALIAERLLGKYHVIIALSLVYCAGCAVMSLGSGTEQGAVLGLSLIALGSGGIKPCVLANVGDQFTHKNGHLVGGVFQAFYFTINFGSFFSTLLTPWLYATWGPPVAFGVPGVLMFLATVTFWLGRNRFVKIPGRPGGKLGALDAFASSALFIAFAVWAFFRDAEATTKATITILGVGSWFAAFTLRQRIQEDNGFMSVLVYAIKNRHLRKPGMGFFDVARERFGDEAAEGPGAVLRVMIVFSGVCVFWALFDQHSTSWINQAQRMNLDVALPLLGELHLKASQMAALNPAMVMVIIPLLNFAVYPAIERLGVPLTPLRKMTAGMFLAALSFALVALVQMRIDQLGESGQKLSALWQIAPYLVLTTSEVLVSATGLEFAYTQAPRAMKSTIMGFWALCVTIGDLLVVFLSGFKDLALADFFWTFALLMAIAAVLFAVLAYLYKGKTYLQS